MLYNKKSFLHCHLNIIYTQNNQKKEKGKISKEEQAGIAIPP